MDGVLAEAPLLKVSGLTIGFPRRDGEAAPAVDRVEFEVGVGETLGILGESGCGKSLTLRALLGLVPVPGKVLAGAAHWKGGRDLLRLQGHWLHEIRGKEIAMIFQDPQSSLNPVYSVGHQLTEVLRTRNGLGRRDARRRAIELFDRVGIPAPERRLRDYPHHLSGGMRQRAMIAIAIACGPTLLLADEPTTALDVTIQAQILDLLADVQSETGMAIILVSHDLGVIEQSSDRVVVMYAGRVVETGDAEQVLLSSRHPYTGGLLEAAPRMPGESSERMRPIDGQPPEIGEAPRGCSFAPRCRFARERCCEIDMGLDYPDNGHASACPFVDATTDDAMTHDAR